MNNCGFFGNETTMNMCPNCYRTYLSSQASTGAQSLSPGLAPASTNGSPEVPPQTLTESQMVDSVDMISEDAGDIGGHVFVEESDSSLLERASMVDPSASLGSARARFPRVQSASESARDEHGAAPAVDEAVQVASGVKQCPNEPAVPADTLVRTNASRALDVDMRHKPSFSPACPSVIAAPTRPASIAAVPPRSPLTSGSSKPNRCDMCRKKVGLTGFKCRCDGMFCGSHRYSDAHSCSFDYKAAGREAIAKANPVVKADKIVRF